MCIVAGHYGCVLLAFVSIVIFSCLLMICNVDCHRCFLTLLVCTRVSLIGLLSRFLIAYLLLVAITAFMSISY